MQLGPFSPLDQAWKSDVDTESDEALTKITQREKTRMRTKMRRMRRRWRRT